MLDRCITPRAMAVTIAAFHGAMLAVSTGAFLTVLRVVEDYVIYPRLISRDIHLRPVAVIVAVLAGADLGGVAGIFVAIPLLALLTVIGRHWLAWRQNGGDDLSVRPSPSQR